MTVVRLFGVRIILSRSFLALLAVLAACGLLVEALILFGVAFMHELAHVVCARLCGLGVAEVELLPFGGVARVETQIELNPGLEAKVALVGPLANAVAVGAPLLLNGLGLWPSELDRRFVEANLLIGGFNLIPALPLDGGRVYRAWLVARMGFRRATVRAARLGRFCGLVLVVLGSLLLYLGHASVSVVAVGFFLFVAAKKEQEEAVYVLMRYLARRRGTLVQNPNALVRHVVVGEDTPLKEVLDHLVPQRYLLVWVLDRRGHLAGFAGELEVIDALFQEGIETPAGRIATPLRSHSGL